MWFVMEFRRRLRVKALIALATAAQILAISLGVSVLLHSSPTDAAQQVPYKVNFQGRLTDNSGNALSDGLYNVKFRLWTLASGGSNVWEEDRVITGTDNRIQVTNGLFNIQFGDLAALSPSLFITGSSTLFLEVELPTPATATCATNGCAVFTEGAMTPRQPLASSPYAFNADTLDGIDSSSFGQLSANNTFTGANIFTPTSGVGITVRAASATHSLDVKDSSGTIQAYFDATGILNVGQTIQATAGTVDLGTSGSTFRTGYFGTSVQTPALNASTSGGTITTNLGTLQRVSSGTTTIDLKDAADTTLAVTNSGGGVAGISASGGLTIGTGKVITVGATAGSAVTCTSGQILDAIVVTGGVVTGGTCVAAGGGDKLDGTWTSQQVATATNTQTTINFTGGANTAPAFSNALHTLTLPSNASRLVITSKGAGGGGGGTGTAAVANKMAGGGGEGGYSQFTTPGSLPTNYYLKVGSGGTPGATTPSAGGTGSSTCFGTNSGDACTTPLANATGGTGGTSSNVVCALVATVTGGSGTGDLTIPGANAAQNACTTATGVTLYSGAGGGAGGGKQLTTALGSGGTANSGTASSGGGGGGSWTGSGNGGNGGTGGSGYLSISVYVAVAGTGNPATLQTAYDNSTNPEIQLSTLGGLTVRDTSGGLGANLLEVQDNTGTTNYLAVTTSGVSTSGLLSSVGLNAGSGSIQGTGGVAITGNSTIAGTLGSVTNLTLSGTISGGTTITGTTINGTTGINTGASAGTNRIDASGNLLNIGQIAAAFTSATAANGQTLAYTNNNAGAGITMQGINLTSTNATAASSGTNVLNALNFAAGTALLASDTTNGINFASTTGYTNLLNSPNLTINASADQTTAFTALDGTSTANGAGTASTTLILTSATNFNVGNYVQMNSANCGGTGVNPCYAKITAIATNTLTITPALTWANASTVNEYHLPEIGGTDIAQPLANRYGRGYFIAGVAAGNGTTFYNEDSIDTNLTTFSLLNTTVTTLNIGGAATTLAIGSGSTTVSIPGSLTVTGNITAPSTGTSGYITRSGTTLSPATAGDNFTTTGAITGASLATSSNGTINSGSGTISSTGAINAGTFTGSGSGLTNLNPTNLVQGSGAVTLQSANASALTLNSGTTGTLNLATQGSAKTIQIGQTTVAVTDTIGIGNSSFAGSIDNITIGNQLTTSSTAIQGGTGATAITLTPGTNGSVLATTTGTGTVKFDTATSIIAETTTNSATAFQVQNSGSEPIFAVGTTTNNLVTNPGFEVDTSGWAGVTGTVTRNVTLGQYYLGLASNTVNVTSNAGGAQATSFTAAVTPGTYAFSFYAMRGTNTGVLGVTITGGSAPACALASGVTVTTGFQRYTCSFTSTTTNVTAITITSTLTGTFFLDAVQLVTSANNLNNYDLGNIQLRGVVNAPAAFQSTSNSTTAFQIQASGGTNLFSIDSLNNNVIVGSQTADATQILLQLDSFSTFADTATCSTTTNQGALYYNSSTTAVRTCLNGAWEDVMTTAGMGILAYGVLPDTGTNPGDLPGLVSAGVSGPCKVSWASATTYSISPCTAYSGGRKVLVTQQTGISVAGMTATSIWAHICLTGANGQPALSATATTENATANQPTWNANNPILCIADILGTGTGQNISKIYDTRMFTTSQKDFVTLAGTVPGLGQLVIGSGNSVAQSGATAGLTTITGVLVALSSAGASATVPSGIIVTNGPVYVKATTTTGGQFLNSVAQAGYGTSVAAYSGTTSYGDVRTSATNTCAAAATCLDSAYVNFKSH